MSKKPAPACRRYCLTLEYDGTGFSGWQKQNDARTLQGSLQVAAQEIFADKKVDIQGHGRTDAGVHALAYTAHLETRGAEIPLAILRQRFNALLPASIVLLDISPCDSRFHARHNCLGRSYL
ncbi:MAG: tRNA pseudouridine(38-40) synthase TruA, partial [Candidatus Electrothrix sp. AR5]|nr:tRNA pseudouridine(38-40) synthase TruA [Candidatus Electrothrix sp. AR5]